MERFVLGTLEGEREEIPYPWERWLPVSELAARRAGTVPTAAQLESMHRAISKLADQGAVEAKRLDIHRERGSRVELVPADSVDHAGGDDAVEHTDTPVELCARAVLTEEERKTEERYERERRRG